MKISRAVGRNGTNDPIDVKLIQHFLNLRAKNRIERLRVDGHAGPKTIALICELQRQTLNPAQTDGRVDPVGPTFNSLAGTSSPAGSASKPTQLSTKGADLLKKIEGLHLLPYDDQTGKSITKWVPGATIGYGHLIPSTAWEKFKNGITSTAADALFSSDAKKFEDAVVKNISAELSDNEFDALVILTYNIGPGGLSGSSVRKILNKSLNRDKDFWENLEKAWKAWNKSQGKIMNGLINRRNAEWKIFKDGIYERW